MDFYVSRIGLFRLVLIFSFASCADGQRVAATTHGTLWVGIFTDHFQVMDKSYRSRVELVRALKPYKGSEVTLTWGFKATDDESRIAIERNFVEAKAAIKEAGLHVKSSVSNELY